jgi:hypothetical protein
MSNRRRKLPKYKVPNDDDLSVFVYLNANGDIMHILFNLPVAGVFEWEDSDGPQQDFFVEFKWEEDDSDNDNDDEYFF